MRALSKDELGLRGYSDRKVAELEEAKLRRPLAKRADMEAMYADLTERRKEALAEVKARGLIVVQDKFSARGELYQIRIPNPALAIARQCELQLAALAKLLGEPPDPKAMTTDQLIARTDELLRRSN